MTLNLNNLSGKKFLVTGATGFSGGHLTQRLLSMGVETTLLVRPSSDRELVEKFKKSGAKIVLGDVQDAAAVAQAVRGQDCVFHLAALFRQAKFPDQVYFDVNVQGTRNVLEAAARANVKRFVHCSTNGVHGHIANPPANEDTPFHPGDVYQVSKLEGEKAVRERGKKGDIECVVIRPAMIWGEGDRRILKMFRGVHKRRFPIIGTGRTLFHWLYVQDLVDGFLLAADNERAAGQVYLLAGRRPVTLMETVTKIAELAGVKPLPFKIPARPVQLAGSLLERLCSPFGIEPPIYRRRVDFFVKNRCFDTTKARAELGFSPRYDFEEEAKRIYTWYKEHGWLD